MNDETPRTHGWIISEACSQGACLELDAQPFHGAKEHDAAVVVGLLK